MPPPPILKLSCNPKIAGKEKRWQKQQHSFTQQNYFIPRINCSRICWDTAKLVGQVQRGDFVHANPPHITQASDETMRWLHDRKGCYLGASSRKKTLSKPCSSMEMRCTGTFYMKPLMPHLDKTLLKTMNQTLNKMSAEIHDWLTLQGVLQNEKETPPRQDNVNISTTDGGMADVMNLLEEVVMTTASSKAMPSCWSNIGNPSQAILGY